MRFYPGLENLILPMLSYPGCHVSAKYIGCIGNHAHGRQVTSLLCQSDVIIKCCLSEYSGTFGSVVSNGEQEKESIIRVGVGLKIRPSG